MPFRSAMILPSLAPEIPVVAAKAVPVSAPTSALLMARTESWNPMPGAGPCAVSFWGHKQQEPLTLGQHFFSGSAEAGPGRPGKEGAHVGKPQAFLCVQTASRGLLAPLTGY